MIDIRKARKMAVMGIISLALSLISIVATFFFGVLNNQWLSNLPYAIFVAVIVEALLFTSFDHTQKTIHKRGGGKIR